MPPKGRRTKKGMENDHEITEEGLPVTPSAGGEIRDKAAVVNGPFEDLLDLQNANGQGNSSGNDVADADAPALDPTEKNGDAAAGGDNAADNDASGDDDAASEMAPDDGDDGYLSDDSDEHLEPDSLSTVIALKPPLKRIMKDPAIILTSTGGSREDWVCVQTACEKARGNRFEQATAHIASARHKGGLRKEGSTTRASKYSQKLPPFKKEFVIKQAKQ
ncbi:unnamed protein product [Closterium sp. NIES-64]|nr:unnamed protein product [Closterium sp. NIES-64]